MNSSRLCSYFIPKRKGRSWVSLKQLRKSLSIKSVQNKHKHLRRVMPRCQPKQWRLYLWLLGSRSRRQSSIKEVLHFFENILVSLKIIIWRLRHILDKKRIDGHVLKAKAQIWLWSSLQCDLFRKCLHKCFGDNTCIQWWKKHNVMKIAHIFSWLINNMICRCCSANKNPCVKQLR